MFAETRPIYGVTCLKYKTSPSLYGRNMYDRPQFGLRAWNLTRMLKKEEIRHNIFKVDINEICE